MPVSSIVRISSKAKETLEELARRSGEPMLCVIDKAIEDYRRRVFLEETNRAYAKLRADTKASKEFDREIAVWDSSLMDGLERPEAGREDRPKSSKGRKKQNHD